jgi:hypothetical protein
MIRITEFMWNHGRLMMKIYFPLMFVNGFYRSTLSIDRYEYKYETEKKKDDLLVEKFVKGCVFGCLYATWYGPFSIFQMIGRLEIRLTDKNPYDYEIYYRELFSYTTLIPPKDQK